jgi:hypothetical protein
LEGILPNNPRKPVEFRVSENGCHICTSHAVGSDGYPMLSFRGKRKHIHRVIYMEAHGEVPPEVVIRHTCDQPLCINLKHLIPGSMWDNAQDRKLRNRDNPPIGERSGTSKLTLEQVRDIRASTEVQHRIALRYGITQSQVSRIKAGKRWGDERLQ